MTRSGYCDDVDDNWITIRWRGAVKSAIRGRRGQAFLKEMLAALDALPERKLITGELEDENGAVCALGAVGKARAVDMTGLEPEDTEKVAVVFGISDALTREIVFMNDEAWLYNLTDEERFSRVRKWIKSQILTLPDRSELKPSHAKP